jgi:ADP-ribose pyrophosphatase YjhB (NUDIX family)
MVRDTSSLLFGVRVKPSGKPTAFPIRGLAKVLRPFSRIRRGLTLGAQGVVIDADNRVLLVRHSYRLGWFFPGGGVEWGETIETALVRELEEEVGVSLTEPAPLHGIFGNFVSFPGDHIAVFVVRHWRRNGEYRKLGEIAETGMFRLPDLPDETDMGTRARLKEIFDRAPIRARW